jgi:hypothetical protein
LNTETKKQIQIIRETNDKKVRERQKKLNRKFREEKGFIKTQEPYEPREEIKYKMYPVKKKVRR